MTDAPTPRDVGGQDPRAPGAGPAGGSAPGVPRQRWRLYVAQPAATEAERRAGPGARGLAGVLAASGLPLGEAGRGRVVAAAPLPLGVAGEREVVDVLLVERRSVAEVRAAVVAALPPGWTLVGLHDVWVGAPAAPAAVVAADYRVEVAGVPAAPLAEAARALLAAATLPRVRRREKRPTSYDLRPLLLGLEVRPAAGGVGATLAMRLRHAPDAVGRPEEVIAALAEPPSPIAGSLTARTVVRERLVMADDADAPPAG